jgi:hypothetical protein
MEIMMPYPSGLESFSRDKCQSIFPSGLITNFISSFMYNNLTMLNRFFRSTMPVAAALGLLFSNAIAATEPIMPPDSSEYYTKDYLRNEDHIYQPNIKTILLYRAGWELTDPVIQLNSGEQLSLSFDDLQADVKSYHYTVVHCNADWTSTDIWPNEYIDGFTDDVIDNYHFSFNTRQHFTHYTLLFPNDKFKVTLSGNYLLKVYRDQEEQNPAFTSRFMVVDPHVTINARISKTAIIEEQDYRQDVSFSMSTGQYPIAEPYRDLHVVIRQNGRWDNALTNLKPYLVKGDELDYNFTDGSNSFEGSNEFRNFSIKSLRSLSEHLREITPTDSGYQVLLWPDARRTFKVYISDKDIDGRLLIKTEDETDSQLEADYAYVHFYLPYTAPLVTGSLYVTGQLSAWQFSDAMRMKYNFPLKRYEATLYLKQGYYNYLYLYLPNRNTIAESALIEGNHYETENSYTIYVYHRAKGTLYDQLIAVTTVHP